MKIVTSLSFNEWLMHSHKPKNADAPADWKPSATT